jgi:hypothetical protein
MQENGGATADEQVEHHLRIFVDAFDAHRRATDSEQKRTTRNKKAECELALAKAYREREKKKSPER